MNVWFVTLADEQKNREGSRKGSNFLFLPHDKCRIVVVDEQSTTSDLNEVFNFHGCLRKAKEHWHWNTVSKFWDVRCLACYSLTSSGIYVKWCSINGRDLSLSQGVLALFNNWVSVSFSQKGELNAHFLLPGWVFNSQANEGKQMILGCRAVLYQFLSTTFQQILLKFLNSCRSANDHHWVKKMLVTNPGNSNMKPESWF